MPRLKPRSLPPEHWSIVFGAAAGVNSTDFYALGYTPDLDEFEVARNPNHQQFTHIFRFKNGQRRVIARIPKRLDDIWVSPSGVVYAAGDPRGVIEIRGDVCTEVAVSPIPGTFAAIWGTGEEHVFACGNNSPFLLYRQSGAWSNITLPAGARGLWEVSGFSETDVYTVGEGGQILHFDGRDIRSIDSPTTRWLTSIAPMPKGRLCIGGYSGILLYGNINGWRFVDTGTEKPLLHIVPYRNGCAFVTPDGLWWFDGASPPQLLVRQGGRWLNSLGDALMIVHGDSAWLFDGAAVTPLDTLL
jgi:hypothetical protein